MTQHRVGDKNECQKPCIIQTSRDICFINKLQCIIIHSFIGAKVTVPD